jgi:putative tryptophan/tyrosine transport system substrate-binding protein
LGFCFQADAQQASKVHRIGMLVSGSVSTHGKRVDAFRQGLRELGYVEGKNITIEYRYGEGKRERFSDLAAEIVRLKPDVIYVASTAFTQAAKKATTTIPIVSTGGDLVGDGIVSSLSRPGGNITGSTNISPDVSGKRLQLLKDASASVSRVAVLYHSNRSDEEEVKQTEIAAQALRITIYSVPVRSPDEFAGAFAAMKKENANALVIIQGSLNNSHIKQLAELAAKNSLRSIGESPDYANGGCLISYGANLDDLWHRGATFVDKILKGAKPADLPVEQPTKFELAINLKTARQIGVTIPPSMLARADKVIK